MRGAKSYMLKVQLNGSDGRVISVTGRCAQTLDKLIEAGNRGITSFHHPGPRLSHYIMCLRRQGIAIETQDERHGGQFSGEHGRYVLRAAVHVLARSGTGAAPHASPASTGQFGGVIQQLGRGGAA